MRPGDRKAPEGPDKVALVEVEVDKAAGVDKVVEAAEVAEVAAEPSRDHPWILGLI